MKIYYRGVGWIGTPKLFNIGTDMSHDEVGADAPGWTVLSGELTRIDALNAKLADLTYDVVYTPLDENYDVSGTEQDAKMHIVAKLVAGIWLTGLEIHSLSGQVLFTSGRDANGLLLCFPAQRGSSKVWGA